MVRQDHVPRRARNRKAGRPLVANWCRELSSHCCRARRRHKDCKFLHLDQYFAWPAAVRAEQPMPSVLFRHWESLEMMIIEVTDILADASVWSMLSAVLAGLGWAPCHEGADARGYCIDILTLVCRLLQFDLKGVPEVVAASFVPLYNFIHDLKQDATAEQLEKLKALPGTLPGTVGLAAAIQADEKAKKKKNRGAAATFESLDDSQSTEFGSACSTEILTPMSHGSWGTAVSSLGSDHGMAKSLQEEIEERDRQMKACEEQLATPLTSSTRRRVRRQKRNLLLQKNIANNDAGIEDNTWPAPPLRRIMSLPSVRTTIESVTEDASTAAGGETDELSANMGFDAMELYLMAL
eukprot:TRINITY_DN4634_c0_g4_i1.p1 TRINITY_DN4634_c0_g4~~TRINITY_DN4634_c0_g4_i1.p1  ORF type:complete len:352 (+),score=74.65 TRINITY_DN4634_c0_g4_i1:70-1125(+)